MGSNRLSSFTFLPQQTLRDDQLGLPSPLLATKRGNGKSAFLPGTLAKKKNNTIL